MEPPSVGNRVFNARLRGGLVQPGSRLLMSMTLAAARNIATAPRTTDKIT